MHHTIKYIKFINLALRPTILSYKLIKSTKLIIKNSNFILGESVYLLEKKLQQKFNAKYVITCANGTDALLLALMSLNIKQGDIVFLPTLTFTSTAESVALLGATPFFIDVLNDSFNLNAADIETGILLLKKNNKTVKAIITVDLFGQPSDFNKIKIISKKYGIPVIIDAAQSLGATYKQLKVGSMGLITTTSFFPTKPFGGFGDGGALFTNNANIYKKVLSLRNHGFSENKYENIAIGLNSRLDTLQAAMLLEKIKFLKKEIKMRTYCAKFYSKYIKKFASVPNTPNNIKSAWALYTVKLKNKYAREKIQEFLYKNSIETRIYYIKPLHTQKIYMNYPRLAKRLYIAEKLSKIMLSLPLYPYMSNKKKNKIIFYILKYFKKYI